VNALRILAVGSQPPEAAPGASVYYAALVVGDQADQAKGSIDWAFCNQQKPLSELNDVDAYCFAFNTSYLSEFGNGPNAQGSLPSTGCALFGPDVPPAMPMMPPGRPADPDLTGGYYQPVRLILQYGDQLVLSAQESRIICGLPGASSDVLAQFKMQYTPNNNPVIAGYGALLPNEHAPCPNGAEPTPDGNCLAQIGQGGSLPVGGTYTLRVFWRPCPSANGCGAEAYAYYDPGTQTVTTRHEAMSVAWYATDGSFASDTTGRTEGDLTPYLDNTWTAPTTAETVTFWAVLRDNRGGVTWQEFSLGLQ
jgi:hypothetical protein